MENQHNYPSELGSESDTKHVSNCVNSLITRSIFWRPQYLYSSAWLEHIPFAFWLVESIRPKQIVELGAHYGTSYFSFCQAVDKLELDAQCFAVDTWAGDEHAGIYGEDVFQHVSEHNNQHYSGFSSLVRSSFDQALDHFMDGSIDLLHIDGLHTLEAVRHDFESWLPKLSERSVVIMHDTNVRERGFGVFQLFDELKQQYPHFEFAHGHGLGIVGVGSQQSELMHNLFSVSANPAAVHQVQEIFSRLGKACSDDWDKRQLQQQLVTLQAKYDDQRMIEQEEYALHRGQLAERVTAQHDQISQLATQLAQSHEAVKHAASHSQTIQIQLDKALQQLDSQNAQLTALNEELVQRAETTVAAQEQITSLQAANQLLEQQRHGLQQQVNVLTLQQSEQTQLAAQLTLSLSQSNQALSASSHEIARLQSVVDQTLQQQGLQEKLLATRDRTLNEQQHQITELLQGLDAERMSTQTYRSQLADAEESLLCSQHESQTLKQSLTSQEQALVVTNAELTRCSARIQQLEQQLQVSHDQQLLSQQQHQQQHCAWQIELAALNDQLQERAHELTTMTDHLAQREQELAAVQAELSTVTGQSQQLEQQLQQSRDQQELSEQQHQQQQVEWQANQALLNEQLTSRYQELATLTQWLEERDQALVAVQAELSSSSSRTQQLEQQLQQSRDQQKLSEQQHQQQQVEWQADQALLNEQLTSRYQELATLTQWLEEKDQAIQQLNTLVAQQQQQMVEQKSDFARREHEISRLNAQLLDRERKYQDLCIQTERDAQQLREQIEHLTQENHALDTNIAERFVELASMTRMVEQHAREVSRLEQKLVQAKERAANLKRTISWRLTAPVRAIGRTFKEKQVTHGEIAAYTHIANSGLFDDTWYLRNYPEVEKSGISPIEHYLRYGAAAGYNPGPDFNTQWYLNTYSDVANQSINPLLHYILHGKNEHRICVPEV